MMLSDVCGVYPVGERRVRPAGRPAGWRVLVDRARLGRPDSRLPLRASVAGLGAAYRGVHPP